METRLLKEKRKAKIVSLRKKGKSVRFIADYFAVSRQRIEQIVKNLPTKDKALFGREPFRSKTIFCSECGKEMTISVLLNRKFCDRKCFAAWRKFLDNPKDVQERHNFLVRERYAKSPEFRLKKKELTYKYLDKIRKDPVKWAAHMALQNAAVKRHQEKKRALKAKVITI